MKYREYVPTALLRDHVECFWAWHSENRTGFQPHRVYPDGCMDIIFNFGAPLLNVATGFSNTYRVFIVGNMTRFTLAQPTGRFDVLGVRFRPGGIYPFLRIPLAELTDQTIPADAILRNPDTLAERLFMAGNEIARVNTLNQWLVNALNDVNQTDRWLRFAIQSLQNPEDGLTIKRLAEQCNISKRQLERQFNRAVGVAPKMLIQIMRFRQTQQAIRLGPNKDLTTIAYEYGYFDHAHMTREFRRFAGLSPSEFRRTL